MLIRKKQYGNVIRAALVAWIALLTGCAGQVNMLPPLTVKEGVKADEGVVVARIINTSGYPLPFNQLTFAPENLNESSKIKPARMQALGRQNDGSTIFASPVKAGRYAINSIRSFHVIGDYFYDRGALADAKFGIFEVKPGQVTDLGNIIYYPKPQEDKYIDVITRMPTAKPGEVLSHYYPFYRFEPDNIIGWADDERDEEREVLYASIAQNPVAYSKTYVAPDGTAYFLGKLGVIVKRTRDGEWQLDAVNSELDLTAIAQNTAGDLFVGGHEGFFALKRNGGDWVDLSFDKNRSVDEIRFFPDNSVVVLVRSNTKLDIIQAQMTNEPLKWERLNSFSYQSGWEKQVEMRKGAAAKLPTSNRRARNIVGSRFSDVSQGLIRIRVQDDGYYHPFASIDSELYSYDQDNWQMTPSRDDFITELTAGNTKLSFEAAGFWSWDGRPDIKRFDEIQQKWIEIESTVYRCNGEISDNKTCIDEKSGLPKRAYKDSFDFKSVPWFFSNNSAIVVGRFSDYNAWTGERKFETKLLITNNGGDHWTETDLSLPKEYCTTLVSEIADALVLACEGASTDFYESYDLGKTWQHVRQQENF